MTDRKLRLAVVGATGAVGRAVLEDLEERDVPVDVRLFGGGRSEIDLVEFRGDELEVEPLDERAFRGRDAAILAVPAAVAREQAPRAWAEGCLSVDLSGAFAADAAVPTVVAGVNDAAVAAASARGIVASPSAPAVSLALALAPIQRVAGLRSVVATVLFSASGSGRVGVRQLEREMVSLLNGEEPEPSDLSHRMGFNLVPQVGAFDESGTTGEENALGDGLRRVLGLPALPVTATAVRVPIFYGHGLVVNVRTERPFSAEAAREALRTAAGVKVVDAPAERVYPMPMLAVGDDAVLVGRIRNEPSTSDGLAFLVVSDNLRRGAAGNAVRIAEEWVRSRSR